MSHIHIPDGVLPLWIVLAGWVVTGGTLFLASRHLAGPELMRRLPLLAVMATVMIAVQSVALPPIGFHFNLSVLTGIVLGPTLGIIAAFIVNLILAMLGHGGITVVGLNTIVLGTEMVIGYYLFRGLRVVLGRWLGVGLAAAGATFLSLAVSTLVVVGIVAVSATNPAWQLPHGPERLLLPNPLGGEPIEIPAEADHGIPPQVEIRRFASLVLLLGLIGWPIEAAITGLIVRYLLAVRPDLLQFHERDGARRV